MTVFYKTAFCKNCIECDRKSPLFKHLSDEELDLVNQKRNEITFKAGEIILKQGTGTTHIVTLTSGLAKVYIEGFHDKNLILKIAKPGEVFVGPGFHQDGRHHYSVAALKDATCCFMDGQAFKYLLSTNIHLANELIRKISRSAINGFEKHIMLTQKQMPGRVSDALLYLSQDIFESLEFDITLSRQDLADLCGLSKESVIRILKDFKTSRFIELSGNDLRILDRDALKRISVSG
jgi:CRP/FNR family transcriptional regulator, polysaccharide utilization system transcription regulator